MCGTGSAWLHNRICNKKENLVMNRIMNFVFALAMTIGLAGSAAFAADCCAAGDCCKTGACCRNAK